MIDSTEALAQYLDASRGGGAFPVCALDTEADSLHRYRESLCLIQFADAREPVLIDPLAIEDLSPLARYLSGATVWMHGADYDMTMLKRQFGELPAVVYDTQIGARLLGVRRFGLGDLVSHYFGVELSKSSQKADWGKRPLSPKMVEYALNDVLYLLEMGEKIVSLLREKGRYGWFEESCIAARRKVLERDDTGSENWRIQGSGKLDAKGLAFLRGLWLWRDAEASAWDRPSFMVATNRQLLEWTADLQTGRNVRLPHHFRSDRIKRFQTALEAVRALPPEQWPERPVLKRRRRDRVFDERLEGFLKRRDEEARALDIDSSLIAPRALLESIAAEEVVPAEVLLPWQRARLGLDA
jgi:ribonuclease D